MGYAFGHHEDLWASYYRERTVIKVKDHASIRASMENLKSLLEDSEIQAELSHATWSKLERIHNDLDRDLGLYDERYENL